MRRPRLSGGRLLVARALLFVASAGLVLVAVELSLRVRGFDPFGDMRARKVGLLRVAEHPEQRYGLTPNAQGLGWNTYVRVNSHGFRDREYPVEKRDAYRIAVIGDSVTFGNGLAAGQTFPSRLERSLARARPRVEVLNLGVGGYDTLQEVAALESTGLAFDPDLVVVGFCVNDAGTHSLNQRYVERLDRLRAPLYASRVAQGLRMLLDRFAWTLDYHRANDDTRFERDNADYIHSIEEDEVLLGMVAALRAKLALAGRARPETTGLPQELPIGWYTSEARLGKLEYAFARLAALAERHGFEVVVLIIPYLADYEPYEIVYEMVTHQAEKRGFSVVDSTADFAAFGLERLRLHESDLLHVSARGHRRLAAHLKAHLGALGIFGSPPAH